MLVFEIYECGDPYSDAWDASELVDVGGEIYRGDLSGMYDRTGLIRVLRELYPGCEIRNRTY
jgi:hypothetical protein